jgi:hypothetical protein
MLNRPRTEASLMVKLFLDCEREEKGFRWQHAVRPAATGTGQIEIVCGHRRKVRAKARRLAK